MRRLNLAILCIVTGLFVIPAAAAAGPFRPPRFAATAAPPAPAGMLQQVRYRHRPAIAERSRGRSSDEERTAAPAASGGSVDWAGSEFWPSAYADTFRYILFSANPEGFWTHGYLDIFHAVLAAGMAVTTVSGAVAPLDQGACRDAPAGAAGAIDRINRGLRPSKPQSIPLEDLRQALEKAEDRVRASCPSATAVLAPPSRLTMMWARLQALRQAVGMVRLPLRDFYTSLDAEQKTQLDALGRRASNTRATSKPGPGAAAGSNQEANVCIETAAKAPAWPAGDLQWILEPTEAQRPLWAMFERVSARLAATLKSYCPAEMPFTPIGRLDAVEDRLDGLIHAVMTERSALTRLYSTLSDVQKARLAAIMILPSGPELGPAREPATAGPADAHSASIVNASPAPAR
jgi:hypothetical protein